MKIAGAGQSSRISKTKSSNAKRSGQGAGFAGMIDDGQDAAASSAVSSLSAPLSLFGLQEVDDPAGRQSKAKIRAEDMLDALEDIRMSLLTGQVSEADLKQLVTLSSSEREKISDPRLESVLDEIDLRARVELAKRGIFDTDS